MLNTQKKKRRNYLQDINMQKDATMTIKTVIKGRNKEKE